MEANFSPLLGEIREDQRDKADREDANDDPDSTRQGVSEGHRGGEVVRDHAHHTNWTSPSQLSSPSRTSTVVCSSRRSSVSRNRGVLAGSARSRSLTLATSASGMAVTESRRGSSSSSSRASTDASASAVE